MHVHCLRQSSACRSKMYKNSMVKHNDKVQYVLCYHGPIDVTITSGTLRKLKYVHCYKITINAKAQIALLTSVFEETFCPRSIKTLEQGQHCTNHFEQPQKTKRYTYEGKNVTAINKIDTNDCFSKANLASFIHLITTLINLIL